MSFDAAIERVLEHEGGYVNDPLDAGGETNYGISKRTYPNVNIAALTREGAIAIYRRDWWERYGYGELPGDVGAKVFDLAVNMGAKPAHKLLQQALRSVGNPVEADGNLGPITRAAVSRAPRMALLAALRSEAAGFYRVLVARNQKRIKWLSGWLRRAYA